MHTFRDGDPWQQYVGRAFQPVKPYCAPPKTDWKVGRPAHKPSFTTGCYVRKLMAEEGIENPTDEALCKFDQKRKKKVSHKEWCSPSDSDGRIAKRKDGRTHVTYKTEHTVDLKSDLAGANAQDQSTRDMV